MFFVYVFEQILTSWFTKILYNSSDEVRKVSFKVNITVEILTPLVGVLVVVDEPVFGK